MPPISTDAFHAAMHSAVTIPLRGRTHLEITGRDRASFLHNFCTNHVKGLSVGQGCEAFLTNIKGRILFHILIYAAPESLWIESDSAQGASMVAHLDRYIITEDVQLHDRSSELVEFYVSGPQAAEQLTTALGTQIEMIDEPGQAVSGEVMIRRFAFGTLPGYSIVGPNEDVERIRERLQSNGVVSAPEELYETLRIEGMFPRDGIDLSEDNLAQEANRTTRAISFAKGCYLGQEPIARLDALGHVNRLLCGVETLAAAELPTGTEVYATSDAASPVGVLTSTSIWPLTGQTIGLGMLRREISHHGTACYLGPERIPARVRLVTHAKR